MTPDFDIRQLLIYFAVLLSMEMGLIALLAAGWRRKRKTRRWLVRLWWINSIGWHILGMLTLVLILRSQ